MNEHEQPLSMAKPEAARVEILDAGEAIRLAEAIVGSHVHGDPEADGALHARKEDRRRDP